MKKVISVNNILIYISVSRNRSKCRQKFNYYPFSILSYSFSALNNRKKIIYDLTYDCIKIGALNRSGGVEKREENSKFDKLAGNESILQKQEFGISEGILWRRTDW